MTKPAYRSNQCFCLNVVTNLLILFVHVGTTGRYHNESLDSLTIILLHGSFLKIVINIYSLTTVFMRLVMFIKRICYVMLLCEQLVQSRYMTLERTAASQTLDLLIARKFPNITWPCHTAVNPLWFPNTSYKIQPLYTKTLKTDNKLEGTTRVQTHTLLLLSVKYALT